MTSPVGRRFLKTLPIGGVVADFFGDLQASERGAVAVRPVADAELGSGNLVGFDRGAVVDEQHFLIADADDHFVAGVLAERGVATAGEADGGKQAERCQQQDTRRWESGHGSVTEILRFTIFGAAAAEPHGSMRVSDASEV